MKYDTVFWDWNGTIIDDVDLCMECVNSLLAEQGLNTFKTRAEYHAVFRFPIIDYYIKAGFDFDKEPFESLAAKYIERYESNCRKCVVFPDVYALIRRLKKEGVSQIILSASEKSGLVDWINRSGIGDCFDGVIGNDNIYAEGKEQAAKDWMTKHGNITGKAVMIGDTPHDVEVAKSIGADPVVIARGHASKAALTQTGAPVFDNADELAAFLGLRK